MILSAACIQYRNKNSSGVVRSVVGTRPFSNHSASLCEAIHTRQKYSRLKSVSMATNTPNNSQPLMGQCHCFWSFLYGSFFAEVKYMCISLLLLNLDVPRHGIQIFFYPHYLHEENLKLKKAIRKS
jgi:hypothetical protein